MSRFSPRDQILVLVGLAIALGVASSIAALITLGDVSRRGREAVRHEFELNQALGQVAASHLEQIAAFEWALFATRPGEGRRAAQDRFEKRAAESAVSLQQAIETARGESGRMRGSPDLQGELERLDLAHARYVGRAREVFNAIRRGDEPTASRKAIETGASSQGFQLALSAVLAEATASADLHLEQLQAEQRRAMWIVAALGAAALLAGIAIIRRSLQLLAQLRSLSGLLPICSTCKSIRDDQGYWKELEIFVEDHSDAQFTHGLCETCLKRLKAEAGL